MKYTQIASDLAYKYYKSGKHDLLFFQSYAAPFELISISQLAVDKFTREVFRSHTMFIGHELQKVTVRQKILCHIGYSGIPPVHDMIVKSRTGKSISEYPLTHSFTQEIKDASWNAGMFQEKWILFDVDENGDKSNFRFEDPK